MVFFTLTKKVNQWLGPFLLRHGLRARYALVSGVLRDNPRLDALLLIPLAQKLISLEVHTEIQQAVVEGRVQKSWSDYLFSIVSSENDDANNVAGGKNTNESDIRIRVLEKYLRPALLNNESWSDVRRWQFHHRLLRWARKEFLLAKYGSDLRVCLDAFPILRASGQLSGRQRPVAKILAGKMPYDSEIGDAKPKIIPSASLISDVFDMNGWKKSKDLPATARTMARIAQKLDGRLIELRGGSLRFAHIPDETTDLSKLPLEDVLEVAGGHVAYCGTFNALCEEANIYQLWTRDYVGALGEYLLKQARRFEGETVILDVGAGDGLLAHFLRDFFENGPAEKSSNSTSRKHRGRGGPPQSRPRTKTQKVGKIPTVVATDDGSWRILQKASVERLNVEESISKYASSSGRDDGGGEARRQVIVLCSWMPMGEDWTLSFRGGNVDEYILIGECDDGQCGDNWETWGNREYLSSLDSEIAAAINGGSQDAAESRGRREDNENDDAGPSGQRNSPPHELDGYERKDLDRMLPFQFSRFDCTASKFGKTVSFRRVQR